MKPLMSPIQDCAGGCESLTANHKLSITLRTYMHHLRQPGTVHCIRHANETRDCLVFDLTILCPFIYLLLNSSFLSPIMIFYFNSHSLLQPAQDHKIIP